MATKPSIPKGTRDFSPREMMKRRYIFSTIQRVFERYGYLPIETPVMENLSTLLGKYGEEGDRLIFKVLNSGDFMASMPDDAVEKGSGYTATKICEKGLRYDLTVPFARYVVQYQNDITFPFKRYQIQPVWRADRPQKGRYREFYQCDVDVVGSNSLMNELELVQIVSDVFKMLNINVQLKLNNRKILHGIAETMGHLDKIIDITVAIDKLEKIGIEAVREELRGRGIDDDAIAILEPILTLEGGNIGKLDKIATIISSSEVGVRGVEEVRTVLAYVDALDVDIDLEIDLSLARGLNYYTGAIFEVKAKDFAIGSICGGGRYDDLTGIFGLKNVSGVGISFGADRIYDVMVNLELFPKETEVGTEVLFVNFGEESESAALKTAVGMRAHGLSVEVYPDSAKMKKQLDYANKRSIPYVIMIGSDELAAGEATVKDMFQGEQWRLSLDKLSEGILHNQ